MEIPFIGGAYTGRSSNINAQECENLFLVIDQEGGKPISLYGTPGLILFSDLESDSEVRGAYEFGDYLYAVCGNALFKVSSDGSKSSVGTLSTYTGPVSIADNGLEIMIVDGTSGYLYDGTTFSTITDVDFPGADTVTYQDGYFIINQPDTDKFYISGLKDGSTWDSLDYASAEGNPDATVAVLSDHRETWNFGAKTVEPYYNSGDADFPFERIPGAFIESGCGAAFSPSKVDNSIFWLNNRNQVVRADGYVPKIISTRQIEYQFSQYGTVSDAIGFTFVLEGNSFYVLTFPTEKATWVFNVATGFWHKWSSYPDNDRHRANCYSMFGSKHIVGDHSNGKLYQLDMDTFADNGEVIRRLRTAQAISEGRKRIFFHQFEVEFEYGVGLITGQGDDPQAMLSYSDDGGHTWSNEKWRSMGKIGEYDVRCVWKRLGSSRNRIFKVVITDPIKVIMPSAYLRATVGKH